MGQNKLYNQSENDESFDGWKVRIANQMSLFLLKVVFDKYKEDVKIMTVQLWCGGLRVMTN